MLIDAHVHIGQYFDLYTTPTELSGFLDSVGVGCFAVSSTSICEGNYRKVLREMDELVQIVGERAFPVLWVIPQMLYDGGMEEFLQAGIEWKCIKINPSLSPLGEWSEEKGNLSRVIRWARKLDLPMLIHTGEMDGCYPSCFSEAIAANPDIRFILAHGRPLDETIDIMKKCCNAYVDTAFMPVGNIASLCSQGLEDRILWGTDYPIPKYFSRTEDMQKYYDSLVESLRSTVTPRQFRKITELNFHNFYL